MQILAVKLYIMGGPSSKRKLKTREKGSLKSKGVQSQDILNEAAQSVLSDELRNQCVTGFTQQLLHTRQHV